LRDLCFGTDDSKSVKRKQQQSPCGLGRKINTIIKKILQLYMEKY